MDWLDGHHVVLDCHNTTFTCLNEDVNQRIVKGIPSLNSIGQITTLKLKKCFRKGCELYATHVEESTKDKGISLIEFLIWQEFLDVFEEVLGFP